MTSDLAVCAENVGKCYQIYNQPSDRLKQALWRGRKRGRKRFFREFWALRDVSFSIAKGETIGIIGSNGSGKSTLLQMMCGVLRPTAGTLHINGRVAALLELGAGFNPEFSGRDNVLMSAAIMGLSRSEIDACYDDIVAFANIGDFIERPVKTYSSGMYVRLAFATAINVSPDILVVDEALSVGDIRFQQKCMARIKNFCKNGTVIFVSHDTGSVTELCSRVIWIEGGQLRMDGPPGRVVEKYIQFMYEGEAAFRDISNSEARFPDHAEKDAVPEAAGFVAVDENIRQFGNRSVRIEKVRMLSDEKNGSVVYSGKPLEIGLIVTAHQDIRHPIVGFLVKDRLGREVIGDTTSFIGQNIPAHVCRRQLSVVIPASPVAQSLRRGLYPFHCRCGRHNRRPCPVPLAP